MTDGVFVRSEVAGRIPIVAVGVPAAGLRGGWRDCCIVNAPERSGLGRAMFYWRWFRGRRSSSRSGGASELGRAEAASVTGVSLARWLRRGRWNCEGVSTARSGGLVELLIVSRRPRHPPLRSTGGWRGLRRSCAWARSAGSSCGCPLRQGRSLEFGHSGRPELGERASVLSGGSRLDHGLAGSGGVAGGKGHRVVG